MRTLIVLALVACSSRPFEPIEIPPGRHVALGAFILDRSPPVDGVAPQSAAAMTNYAAMVGQKPAIVMWYAKWTGSAFPAADLDRVVQFGATPMITWEACNAVACQTTTATPYTDQAIVNGQFDGYLKMWAQGAKAWGKPFFLRPLHEMNGNWYPWATGAGNPNQNTPADFIAAWKHLHQIFADAGVTNAIWVWSPNVGDSLASDYPGDEWVDWVALDGYNWGSLHDGWDAFGDIFGASYTQLVGLTAKPLMFAETACAPAAGDKATWIKSGFLGDVPSRFPKVRAIIWYDTIRETDWRVNSSSASLAAWQAVVATPYFQAGPPLH